jgi:hypothetical protein
MFKQVLNQKCEITTKQCYCFDFVSDNKSIYRIYPLFVYVPKKQSSEFLEKIPEFISAVNKLQSESFLCIMKALVDVIPNFSGELFMKNYIKIIMKDGKIKESTDTSPSIIYYNYNFKKPEYKVFVNSDQSVTLIKKNAFSGWANGKRSYRFSDPVPLTTDILYYWNPKISVNDISENCVVKAKEGFHDFVITKNYMSGFIDIYNWATERDKSLSDLSEEDLMVYAIE